MHAFFFVFIFFAGAAIGAGLQALYDLRKADQISEEATKKAIAKHFPEDEFVSGIRIRGVRQ